jgi:hypothetical protein
MLQHMLHSKNNRARNQLIRHNNIKLILAEIVMAGREGIHQKDLLPKVGLDRTNVYRLTKRLALEKKIRIIFEGKMTRYIATHRADIDDKIAANIVGRKFVSKVIGESNYALPKNQIVYRFLTDEKGRPSDKMENADFTSYHKYIEPKFTQKSELERSLYEFANQVGAYITFLFIQFMNPNNRLVPFLHPNNSNTQKGRKDKGDIVMDWINNSISSVLPLMLSRFGVKCLERGHHFDRGNYSIVQGNNLWVWELDKKTLSKLSVAFRELYPRIDYELKGIMDNLPHSVKIQKDFLDDLSEKHRDRKG